MTLENGEDNMLVLDVVPADLLAGNKKDVRWAQGVLDQERTVTGTMYFKSGIQELKIGALEAGSVIFRVLICRKGMEKKRAYLGPWESWYVK